MKKEGSFKKTTKSCDEGDYAENSRELPSGMGYKSCWMVVEGASRKAVMAALLQGRKMKYTYQEGLEKLAKAGTKENKLLVTADYNRQNYVIGMAVGRFFYDTEEFLKKCGNFRRVYVYMTERVNETHGFALVENGQLVRLFSIDENEIQNIGQPLPEEIELGYHLPESFADVRNKEGIFTEVNEDMIMELAIRQVGIAEEKYPYKDVIVGKLFTYEADMADDPYPGDDAWDVYPKISEEVMELPEVQRFKNAGTYQEKLEIAEALRDVITHPMMNAFGEYLPAMPGYGRLSARYEELLCIIATSAYCEKNGSFYNSRDNESKE